jgi:hypothetical protein
MKSTGWPGSPGTRRRQRLTATAFYSTVISDRQHDAECGPDQRIRSNIHETPVHDYGGSLQWTTRLGPTVPMLAFGPTTT